MAVDLSAYTSIQTNLFVKLDIPGYDVLTFSDYHKDYTIAGTVYQGLGELLSVSATTNNLRAAPDEITVGIAGIPSSNITDIINNPVKGSSLKVYRAFFNPTTGELLPVSGNPAGKFQGVVSNYNLSDELEMGSDTGTIALILTVTSVVELLQNKVSGRRTNPADFPTESSMGRVMALAKSNFNFGAPT
jgi:hypothetical protein